MISAGSSRSWKPPFLRADEHRFVPTDLRLRHRRGRALRAGGTGGGGPGGRRAALWWGGGRRKTLVCDIGEPRNIRSGGIHNYLTRDGTPPAEFLQHARQDVARYSTVELRQVEVLDAARSPDGFRLVCGDGRQIAARKLLLATGVLDELPELEGLQSLYGTSVHHCPYCDGWE